MPKVIRKREAKLEELCCLAAVLTASYSDHTCDANIGHQQMDQGSRIESPEIGPNRCSQWILDKVWKCSSEALE